MAARLPEHLNPYGDRTPFDVLGVTPSADANALKMAQKQRLEDIEDLERDDEARIAKRREIKDAYDALSNPRSRAMIELFIFDRSVGREECRKAAEEHKALRFDFGTILQRSEDVFPSAPELHDPQRWFGEVDLGRCVALTAPAARDGQDAAAREALGSISFDL